MDPFHRGPPQFNPVPPSTQPFPVRPSFTSVPHYQHPMPPDIHSHFVSLNQRAVPQMIPQPVHPIFPLFIGSIPSGITDENLETLLKACGPIRSWKRPKDPAGNPKKFGFCEFVDPEALIRALRFLGNISPTEADIALEPLTLPTIGSDVIEEKALLLRLDEEAKKYLTKYREKRPRTENDDEMDKMVYTTMQQVILEIRDPKAAEEARIAVIEAAKANAAQMNEGLQNDMGTFNQSEFPQASEQVTSETLKQGQENDSIISQQLAMFREKADIDENDSQSKSKALETAKTKEDSDSEYEKSEKRSRSNSRSTSPKNRNSSRRRHESRNQSRREREKGRDREAGRRNSRYRDDRDRSRGRSREREEENEDEETIELKKAERRARELEIAFKERLQRWESREENRARLYEREAQREEEIETRFREDFEYQKKKFAEWNDDVEKKRGEEEYYRDRSRWRRHREIKRQREEEMDLQDVQREKEEIEEAKRREEEEERKRKEELQRIQNEQNLLLSMESEANEENSSIHQIKAKLNFNINKKRSLLSTNEQDDGSGFSGDEERVTKRRVLVPLAYDITNEDPEVRETRLQKLRDLANKIPAEREGLWKWQVKWEMLDEKFISTKLKSFVSKKIVELVGEQEEDLVEFVVESIRGRAKPSDLVGELEGALDEDTELFIMKLWRMIILESESKSLGLI